MSSNSESVFLSALKDASLVLDLSLLILISYVLEILKHDLSCLSLQNTKTTERGG
jgi:hypothetical protein